MIWRGEWPWGILPDGFPFFFSFCLRRVTFVNSDKSNQKRHSRGKGFRFPPERALRVRLTIFAKQKSVF